MTAPKRSGRIGLLWMQFRQYHVARLEALERARLDVVRFDVESLGSRSRRWPWVTEALLWRRLGRAAPSVLFIHGYRERSALAAALWGRLHGARNVLMSDSTYADRPRKRWRERLKAAAASVLFDRALVSGRRAASYLEGLGFSRRNIGCCYDVVDNGAFASRTSLLRSSFSPSAFGLPGDYFLFVGRMIAEKNLSGLVRAFAAYRHQGGTAALVLVGGGPLEGAIRELVHDLGLDEHVQFAGPKESDQLAPFYAFARCLVLASISESWGLVVNEAMASSLPVLVSYRCGCSADLVREGENGFTFDPFDAAALAAHMLAVSALPPERISRMGAASLLIIGRYSLERWASEVRRLAQSDCREDSSATVH